MAYDDAAALYPGLACEGGQDYPVEFHVVDEMQIDDFDVDDEIKEMKRAEIEAYKAAQIIRESRGLKIYE